MKSLTQCTFFVWLILTTGSIGWCQSPQHDSESQEHKWLQKFVGTWDVTIKSETDISEEDAAATMTSSMLGDLWIVNKSRTTFPGMHVDSIQTIGFDVKKQKYVGTWVDSMSSHIWRYEGSLDSKNRKLSLYAEGPAMSGDGTTQRYVDTYEFTSDDSLVATSSMLNDKKIWVPLMTGTGKRRKSDNTMP